MYYLICCNEEIPIIEAWLSLVERCVRDAEVAGSNPVASTKETAEFLKEIQLFLFVFQ